MYSSFHLYNFDTKFNIGYNMNKIESFFVNKVGVSLFTLFSLLLSLFLLWGFTLGLLDVLNKHYQELIITDSTKFSFVLIAFYAAYLLMPLPASLFTERFGYKNGMILGLVLYALGAFMMYPTSEYHSYSLFVTSFFVIACGIATLETVVNPYAALVGKNKYSSFRITLGHSFTSLGWLFGPFVGSRILFDVQLGAKVANENEFTIMTVPYIGIGILVLLLALLVLISQMPSIKGGRVNSLTLKNPKEKSASIFKRKYFLGAVVTMAFYIAAQTAVFGFYTRYLFDLFKSMESQNVLGSSILNSIIRFTGNTDVFNDDLYKSVSVLLFTIVGMGLFTLGRFVGSFILIKYKPNFLLVITSIFSLIFTIVMWMDLGLISFIALCLITLSISTMFPVIFSLGIRKMGYKTKRASALLIMAIVGGATYPFLIYSFPLINPVNIGLSILCISFVVITLYGYKGFKIDDKTRANLNL